MLKNSIQSISILFQNEIQYGQRFYAKKMVSKRVYEILKREKVNWDAVKSPEEFKALCQPLDSRPFDNIKPTIGRMVENIEKYLNPNIGSKSDGVSKELETNKEMGTDLEVLIGRIKYQDIEMQEQEEQGSTTERDSDRLLKRHQVKTASQILKENEDLIKSRKPLSAIEREENNIIFQMKVDAFETARNSYLRSQETAPNELQSEDPGFKLRNASKKILKARAEKDDMNMDDVDSEEITDTYITLAQQLQAKRVREQQERAGFKGNIKKEKQIYNRNNDISNQSTPKLKDKLSNPERGNSRFYYKAGKGSPLYEFSKYQLEDINRMEKKTYELEKERSAYDINQ